MNAKPSERSNAPVNARSSARSNNPQQNPAVMELQAVRTELEGVRNELIGLRADLKDKKTFRMADQVAIGILLAGFASFAIAVVFGIFVALLGRR